MRKRECGRSKRGGGLGIRKKRSTMKKSRGGRKYCVRGGEKAYMKQ